MVGLLPRQDIQPDVIECFASACHQQLFAIGREGRLHDEGAFFPQRIDRHGLEVEPIERLAGEGHFRQIIVAGTVQQVAAICAHIIQVGGVMAKRKLLKEAALQVIPP